MVDPIDRAAAWSGWPLSPRQRELLAGLERWLRDEAIPAGGLGPNEGDRLRHRHLADSLVFAGGWPGSSPPRRLVDLGAGVGLPGLPLAILWPTTATQLVERSGKRADLARRAVGVLSLPNVEVEQGEASRASGEAEMVVARAAAAPEVVRKWAHRLLTPDGRAVIGGSWQEHPSPGAGEQVVEVPAEVLDRPVWLRIMAAS